MEQWSGKVALVTGAGGGIGGALVESLVKSGMNVVGCDCNLDSLTVNVLALSICTREAIKSMKERNVAGHIVHVLSLGGHYSCPPRMAMYSASKHAVRSLTESLRVELRQEKSDIRISSVSPGMVNTDMGRIGHSEEKYKQLLEVEGILLPEDVVSAIIYMLSCPPRVQVHDILIRATHAEY